LLAGASLGYCFIPYSWVYQITIRKLVLSDSFDQKTYVISNSVEVSGVSGTHCPEDAVSYSVSHIISYLEVAVG